MPKALLLPSYLGGGFGHISRCLALAESLESRGWSTALALGGQHLERVGRTARPGQRLVYPLASPRPFKSRSESQAAFTVVPDFSYQLVRDGLIDPPAIRRSLAEQLHLVWRFKPDVLVSDTWPLARVLAHLSGLPLVQITRPGLHPDSPGLLWWQNRPAELVSPDPLPVFNPLLESWGLAPIHQAEDLLRGDLYLVPSIPELDPFAGRPEQTHYIGPLTRSMSGVDARLPDWLVAWESSQPLVYVTTGGGAGSVGSLAFYRALLEALAGWDVRAVVSTGARISPGDLPTPPPNVRLESWVPGPSVIACSQLVVYSGGYGTTMELVQAGVPGLVIPSHSEQESNGRRLEAAGAARVLLPAESGAVITWHNWRGGRFSSLVYPHSDLNPGKLKEYLRSALSEPGLKAGAERLQTAARRYQGPGQAVDLLEDLLASAQQPPRSGWDRLGWREKISLRWGWPSR